MIWILALSLWAYDASGALVAYCDAAHAEVTDRIVITEVANCENIGGTEPPVDPPPEPEQPAERNLCFDDAQAQGWNCLAFDGLEEGTGVTGSNVISQQATVTGSPNRTHVYAIPAGPDSNTSGSVRIVPGDGTFKSYAMDEIPRTITGNHPRGKCEGWGSTGDVSWRIDDGGGCSELGHSSGFVYYLIGSSTPGHGFTYKIQYSAGQ